MSYFCPSVWRCSPRRHGTMWAAGRFVSCPSMPSTAFPSEHRSGPTRGKETRKMAMFAGLVEQAGYTRPRILGRETMPIQTQPNLSDGPPFPPHPRSALVVGDLQGKCATNTQSRTVNNVLETPWTIWGASVLSTQQALGGAERGNPEKRPWTECVLSKIGSAAITLMPIPLRPSPASPLCRQGLL